MKREALFIGFIGFFFFLCTTMMAQPCQAVKNHLAIWPIQFESTFADAGTDRVMPGIKMTQTGVAPAAISIGPITGNISACAGMASTGTQQFTVSATGLSFDITAIAPANFEISVSPTNGYSSSITLTQTGGNVNTTVVYVRSVAAAPNGFISGNVTLSSQPLSQTVAVSGLVNTLPTVDAVTGQSVLNGEQTAAVNFTGTANSFTWTNDTPGIGLAASGIGNIAPFTAINTGKTAVTATIVVSPVFLQLAYIANSGSNNVSVINTATNQVVTTIPVGKQPLGTIASPDGSRVYVSNSMDNTVSVINTTTNTVIAAVPVNSKPMGFSISPDGSYLYVTDNSANFFTIINTATNLVEQQVGVGNSPVGIAADPNDFRVYIASSGANTVTAAAAYPGLGETIILVGSKPCGIAITADGGLVYVANNGSNNVSVIDNATGLETGRIPAGSGPYGVAVSANGSLLYVTNSLSGSVSVINTASKSIIKTIAVGSNPNGISLSPDGSMAYVINKGSNNVSVINTSTYAVVATIAVGQAPGSISNVIKAGSSCSGTPAKFTITVEPNSGPTIIADSVTGAISACQGSASSSPYLQQVSVSGFNLTGDITATAPANFEVSLSAGSGYNGAVTLTQTGGKVSAQTVYVRSAATATAGNLTGTVALTSPAAPDKSAAVAALVRELPLVNPVLDQTVMNGQPTTAISFTGTGSTYNWVNDTPGIGLPASGTGNIASFTAVNTTNAPIAATITATPQPAGYAYIACGDVNGILSVVNTATNKVVANIPVGQYPNGVCASPDGTTVYVASTGSQVITVVSTATNTVIATIPAGINPLDMVLTPDGSKLYVTYGEDDTIVSVINTATNTVVDNIPFGYWNYGMTVSRDGSLVYVVNETFNNVGVINTATNLITENIPAESASYVQAFAFDAALSPDGSQMYVTNSQLNTVSVLNTATAKLSATILVGQYPTGIIMSQDGSLVYVSNQYSNTISVISTATKEVIATINVGSRPFALSFNPDGSRLYVTNYGTNNLSVIDTKTNTLVATVDVGVHPQALGNFVIGPTGCRGVPIVFHITVNPSPHPIITANGTLSPLTTIYGTPSTSAVFTVSGTTMAAGILVTPPAGFEVSADDINFNKTITVGGAGTIAVNQVYIRLAATTHVGAYSGNITLSSSGAADVVLLMPESTVSPAPLIITADNKSKTVGDVNPPLTATYQRFVNDDSPAQLTSQAQISTAATTFSPVGQYPISVGGAASPDYTISYVNGILTVIPLLVIPNTFTPNGDGINDTWNIKFIEFYPGCNVMVFNRYGQNVYSSTGYAIPWDGSYKGGKLPVSTYYYIIDLKNGSRPLSGFIAIIR